MELFGFSIGSKKAFAKIGITETDASWINDQFAWLIKQIGYPYPGQVLYEEKFFPRTIGSKSFSHHIFLHEIAYLLGLSRVKIEIDFFNDDSQLRIVPYARQSDFEMPFIELVEPGKSYRLFIPDSFKVSESKIRAAICEMCIRIILPVPLPFENEDNERIYRLLSRIGMIYMGVGVFINDGQNLILTQYDSGYLSRHRFDELLPTEWIAYALGLFSYLTGDHNQIWLSFFKKEVQIEFELVMEYLSKYWPKQLPIKTRNGVHEMQSTFEEAHELFKKDEFNKAINILHGALDKLKNPTMRGEILNSIGYYQFCSGEIEASIDSYKAGIEMDPEYAYLHDNLSLSYILTNQFEQANVHLNIAMQLNGNDMAYSYRNKAVYYHRLGKMDEALVYFKKAYAENSPVDFLHYFYAKFLFDFGEQALGEKYLKKEKRTVYFKE